MSGFFPTTDDVAMAYVHAINGDTWVAGRADALRAEFDRWLGEVSREERNAERRGIMDLLDEMIKLAVRGDDLEGLCAFREALIERNDK